mmetsp:Transcript_8940/g.8835  ORF Transcript_8940/g.8835 Transcript_8940/m.8835 type:complete len:204 (-) Transcript_8940:1262-1873(-)
MPEVGSSRKTILDPPMKAIPTDNFLFCPPDRVLEYALRFSVNPTLCIIFSTSSFRSALLVPLNVANSCKCSSTVNISNRISCWGQTPRFFLIAAISVLISSPSMVADPAEGGVSPVNMEIAVVLPAPLCPKRAVICPEYMFKFKPSTATFFPVFVLNSFTRSLISTQVLSSTCAFRLSVTPSIAALAVSSPSCITLTRLLSLT